MLKQRIQGAIAIGGLLALAAMGGSGEDTPSFDSQIKVVSQQIQTQTDKFTAAAEARQAASCGMTSCWDQCTNSFIQVFGDSCSTSWNSTKACWTAVGVCNGGPNPPNPPRVCGGVSCWDLCSSSFIFFTGANTCHQIFSPTRGCYAASASCE